MATTNTREITQQAVLRVIYIGFALVVALLGAAGIVALRGTRAIEEDTARVVREQLLMARLFNDVQAGQNTLAVVLHRLTLTPEPLDRSALLAALKSADAALDQAVTAADGTAEAPKWRDLQSSVHAFSGRVREILRSVGRPSDAVLAELFRDHDQVVLLVSELLAKSSQRVAALEAQIERESGELAGNSSFLLGSCLALSLLCSALTVHFARRSIRRIEWHANELNKVSWHMLQSQESAARRFSHELHDELGQSLAAVKASLTSAAREEHRDDCVLLVDEAIANVRELSQLLRPVILDDFGLDAGLRWLTERFAQRTGIRVDYASTLQDRLADDSETQLFRIAQEALTNIARHSGATRVTLELDSRAGDVYLAIEDNGRGIPEQDVEPHPSLGMTGMRARARYAGGELLLTTPPGGGLRIEVRVPAAPKREHAEAENTHPVS